LRVEREAIPAVADDFIGALIDSPDILLEAGLETDGAGKAAFGVAGTEECLKLMDR
jgi:hypothetical protein